MKKVVLITLLIVSMLTMVGFAETETSYWNEMKDIYEWNGIKGDSEIELTVVAPDMNYKYKIHIHSESNLEDFSSYTEMEIEDAEGLKAIPTIKMYTHGSDIYINKEAVLSLISTMGIEKSMDIQEEYIMLKGSENGIKIDKNILKDMIKFIEDMDLDVDLDMVQKDNTYTLTLDSDTMIELLDAYMRYIITNIDQLPNSLMQEEITLTAEQKQEALEAYDNVVVSYKEMAKEFISGSKYHQESTFEDDKYGEKVELVIKTPMGQLDMKTVSTSTKLDSADIQLPESVKTITEQELTELLMGQLITEEDISDTGLKAVIKMDGSYTKFEELDLEEGTISLKLEEGKAYITAEDAHKIFDIQLENVDGYVHIRELDNYGFDVNWNEDNMLIEIYK